MKQCHRIPAGLLALVSLLPAAWAQQNKVNDYGRAMQEVLRIQQRAEEEERRKALAAERLRQERARAEEAEARRAEAQARAAAEQKRAAAPEPKAAEAKAEVSAPAHVGRLVIPAKLLRESLMTPVDTKPVLSFEGYAQLSPNGRWLVGVTGQNNAAKLYDLETRREVLIDNPGAYVRFFEMFGNETVLFKGGIGSNNNLLVKVPTNGAPSVLALPAGTTVLDTPMEMAGRFNRFVYLKQPSDEKTCRAVLAFDPESGQIAHRMEVSVPATTCMARVRNGTLEALASDAGRKRHWLLRNGAPVSQIDTPENTWIFYMDWRGDWVTVRDGGQSTLRSMVAGRPSCTESAQVLTLSQLEWGLGNRLLRHSMDGQTAPAFYNLTNCTAEVRGTPGQRLGFMAPGQWALVRDTTGEIDILDGEGPAIKYRVTMPAGKVNAEQSQFRFGVQRQDNGNLAVYDSQLHFTRLFDAAGTELGSLTGRLDTKGKWSLAVKNTSTDATKVIWKTELFDAEDAMAAMGRRAQALALLIRDEYESTAAWRQRLDQANLRRGFIVQLGPYDPDTGRFPEATFGNARIDLRMPADVARALRGQTTAGIFGRLRVVDASHIELTEPEVIGPDGQRLGMLATPAASCAADLAGLAPAMRAYTHPRLASTRERILATRIDTVLEKAQAQGFTPSAALAATRKQSQTYAQEAQQLFDDADAGSRADLQRAVNDALMPGYNCDSAAGQQVCRFLERSWQARASREVAKALECRL